MLSSSIAIRFALTAASLAATQQATSLSDRFPADKNPQYFPSGVFADGADDGDFRARWYAKHLRAMKEPVFSAPPMGTEPEVYRFLWLRTFHHPIAVRIASHEDGKADAIATMADGLGGYAPGKILSQASLVVDAAQVARVHDMVRATDFWSSPTELPRPGHQFDGAEWILEGASNGRYHVVDRWSPRDRAFRDLALYLVFDIAKFHIARDEIY